MIIPGCIKLSLEKKREERLLSSIKELVAFAGSVKRNDAPENHGCEEGKSYGPPASIGWRTDMRNRLNGQWPNLQQGIIPISVTYPQCI
ncbi:MAG TPA: hypothetical protein VLY86_01480 [Methanothrix sp.]|nr:hypothetical protein [Methanothrix sp.]